jgi:large subunit ribosomal protein L15
MTVKKRSKVRRMRGSKSHGWGRHHRGSGNRAGSGSGLGKHADAKKRSFPADYFGKHGFKLRDTKPVAAITLRDLDSRIEAWVAAGKAKKENGTFSVDLGGLGYGKLVGGGVLTHKLKVQVAKTSAGAATALKEAGGELVTG